MTSEERVSQFTERWAEADKRGEAGHRVEYALSPLLNELNRLRNIIDLAIEYADNYPDSDEYSAGVRDMVYRLEPEEW